MNNLLYKIIRFCGTELGYNDQSTEQGWHTQCHSDQQTVNCHLSELANVQNLCWVYICSLHQHQLSFFTSFPTFAGANRLYILNVCKYNIFSTSGQCKRRNYRRQCSHTFIQFYCDQYRLWNLSFSTKVTFYWKQLISKFSFLPLLEVNMMKRQNWEHSCVSWMYYKQVNFWAHTLRDAVLVDRFLHGLQTFSALETSKLLGIWGEVLPLNPASKGTFINFVDAPTQH